MTTTFAELGLNEQILAGVESLGFSTPTPVQAGAIPEVLAGRDVVASAQTGTGKTAAFALPTLQRIAGKGGRGPHALVVTPTRELAAQIDNVVKEVCEQTGQRAVIVRAAPALRSRSSSSSAAATFWLPRRAAYSTSWSTTT